MTSRTTHRRPCNHALHLILSIITFGVWLPVWGIAAAVGRRETVTYRPYRPYPPQILNGGTYAVPAPEPNSVNPYNGQRYYDPSQPPLTYPAGHPVHYGR